ncbi:MAG TPA: phosphatase PAP2 family protein, partial [Burkholderiales bacterium]
MMVLRTVRVVIVYAFLFWSAHALAGGIDHRLNYDNSGIWNRSVQNAVLYSLVSAEIIGGVWEGGETRLGKTFWQSI